MKLALSALLVVHGIIHLLGFSKGFNLAPLAQLQLTISRTTGIVWLVASISLLTAAVGLQFESRFWGIVALVGAALSQILIVGQFKDAKYGTIANLIILIPALINGLDMRPGSLRSRYERAGQQLLARSSAAAPVVTIQELAHLPEPVQRYLQRVGVVGKPRVTNLHVVANARMRRAATEAWMPSSLDQYSSFGDLHRLFFMIAHKGALSFDVFHYFTLGQAHMEAKVLGLFPVVNASGNELTQSETVTVLNDMCLLAPASLLDSRLTWEPLDGSRCRVTLSHAGHRVSAELHFNASGELVNFISNDRFQSDGQSTKPFPWMTPVSGYRDFNGYHLPASAEARWEEPAGLWTYAETSIEHIEYNLER